MCRRCHLTSSIVETSIFINYNELNIVIHCTADLVTRIGQTFTKLLLHCKYVTI